MTFPGTVLDVSDITEKIDQYDGIHSGIIAVALTLLDNEVGFHVASDSPSSHTEIISRLTYARQQTISTSRFIFVLGCREHAFMAVQQASPGTLIDPHLGATVVMEVASMTGTEGNGASHTGDLLSLEGPGIRSTRTLSVADAHTWIGARAQKNREYPLGVDLILVSRENRLSAIPRTTRISIINNQRSA
jgi:alpha-D-ribose 1-methylphosphonate 5-triphosphate synthase subunit PhnH